MKSISNAGRSLLAVFICLIFAGESRSQDSKLIIYGGALVNLSGGSMYLKNTSVINNGNLIASKGSNVIFSGSNPSYVSGSNAIQFDTLSINKAADAKVWLETDLYIGGLMIMNKGKFDLSDKAVYLNPNSLIENECSENYITGGMYGSINIDRSVNGAYAENTGKTGIVVNGSNLCTVKVSRSHAAVSQINSINRVYTVSGKDKSAFHLNSIRLTYFDNELNGNDENDLSVWYSRDGITWEDLGFDIKDSKNNYIELKNTPSAGMFTLAKCKADNRLKIFPNPASATVLLSVFSKNDITNAEIKLIDARGQTTSLQLKEFYKGLNNVMLDVSRLAAGVYHVLIQSPSLSWQSKLVKL